MSEVVPVVGRGFAFEDLRKGFRFPTHRATLDVKGPTLVGDTPLRMLKRK